LTPIIGSLVGDIDLTATAHAVVLNMAFEPNPGGSVQKFVLPTGALNATDVIAACLEPDDQDADGYYRSPCLDSSTPDPADTLTLRFEQGTTIAYRLRVGNSGTTTLSGVTVDDSQGPIGCGFPTLMPVRYVQVCDYTRTAPDVGGSAVAEDFVNIATIDATETEPAQSDVTVIVEKPPARLLTGKWTSPFELGDDGDGDPDFGFNATLTVTYSTQIPQPAAWFQIVVFNDGGQPATDLVVADSRGPLPANADCPPIPSTLAPGASWICRYRESFSSASPAANPNTVDVTGSNLAPDSDNTHTATVTVEACSDPARSSVPDLIGLSQSAAEAAWSAAGFTGTLDATGLTTGVVRSQGRFAYECVDSASGMTVS
jgi:hypothetical protein